MPAPSDRKPSPLEVIPGDLPQAPLNLTCASGFESETYDLHWSLPTDLSNNSKFSIIGVNIYRSFDSEFGPWVRLNNIPVGTTFYRDKTRITVSMQEDVSNAFLTSGDTDPGGKWVFQTKFKPIHLDPSGLGRHDRTDLNAFVTVDGVQANVETINIPLGQIELRNYPVIDPINQSLLQPVLPKPGSIVLATYKYVANQVVTSLAQRIFYRVTSVAADITTGQLIETRLEDSIVTNNRQSEQLNYIWKEAIRRNKFILYQGGERVKVFIRKNVGAKCGCYSESNKQPQSDCLVCYGTGVIGGYDGPFDILLAPDNSAKSIAQGNRGRTYEHEYETWTSPSPLLSQRDFIVKLNGDRYGIGPVTVPNNAGMQLQQQFEISHLDQGDIRYRVPMFNALKLVSPQTRYILPGQGQATPMLTNREDSISETQLRGNSATFENIKRK